MEKNEPRNPFITDSSFTLKFVVKRRSKKMVEPGKGNGAVMSTEWFYADQVPKLSIYKTEFFVSEFPKLKSCSMNLLIYISIHLTWGRDRILLDRKKFLKWVGSKSGQTYYNAVTELVDRGFIAPYLRGEYWINPAVMFYGDRRKYAEKNGVIEVINTYDGRQAE